MTLKIGEVAALAKVSVRTLHHYDEMGLLSPGGRTEAGYRLYSRADLEKLQQILFYRTLEFPLEKILLLMSDPDFDRSTALRQQRELITKKADQLDSLLVLIDKTIKELEEHTLMELKDMFDAFPDMTTEMVQQTEAEWGDTPAYRESMRRVKGYKRNDWEQMKVEMGQVNLVLETLFSAGTSPDSGQAIAAIDAARLHIDKWFYECSRDFHVRLTAMTAVDERYRKNIDANGEGLAAWMHEAAKANADTKGG